MNSNNSLHTWASCIIIAIGIGTFATSLNNFIAVAICLFGIAWAGIFLLPELFRDDNYQPISNTTRQTHHRPTSPSTSSNQTPKSANRSLTLDSVSAPVSQQTTTNSTQASNVTPQAVTAATVVPPQSVGPGDFEKALAHAGQKMDTLLTQTTDLTRLLKLAEKEKTDAILSLNNATKELNEQLGIKDSEISRLTGILNQKSNQTVLRALINIKKICGQMLKSEKIPTPDELVNFITGEIDDKLNDLDIQSIEFKAGTKLLDIPGDQVDVSLQQAVPTDEISKDNTVSHSILPCYYIESDSKKIIINKAIVALYRFSQPTNTSITSNSI